jgi:uncharacterized membrane protein YfcA
MNIAAVAHRFFLFGGAMLIAIALVQLRLRHRSRDPGERRNPVDATVVRVVLFAGIGVLAMLIGAGVIPMARLR